MAEIKTKANAASVEGFLNNVKEEQQRKDSFVLLEMMQKASGEKPRMWGATLIGFGDKIYKSPNTGREVAWFTIGFSPRKGNFSIYLMGFTESGESLKKLGKHKTGVGCLYINKLSDVDLTVLKKIIEDTIAFNRKAVEAQKVKPHTSGKAKGATAKKAAPKKKVVKKK
ncbi:MAG: DUF1801 domain-containing protein [Chitinophagales bacterium]